MPVPAAFLNCARSCQARTRSERLVYNVEYVAAEKVGAETVTYVSNIYKYYIALQTDHGSQGGKRAGRGDDKGPEQKDSLSSQQGLTIAHPDGRG